MKKFKFRSLKEAATTSEFYKLLDSGLKTKMMAGYKSVPSEYEALVSFETSTKQTETYPSLSDISEPTKVLESEEYPERGVGASQDVDITNFKYGEIIAITREMIEYDQTKKMKNQPTKLGKAHKNYENRTVFSAIVNGTDAASCYDGLAIYTTNHLNRKGGAAQANNDNIYTSVTMTAGALIVALDMINLWKGLDDGDVTINPEMIVCSTRLIWTANWLMSPNSGIPAYAANALGPASAQAQTAGKSPLPMLAVKGCKWLTKVGGAALDWYIWTDVPGWVWQWFSKLRLLKEGNLSQTYFERDVMRWRSDEWFGFKNIDWRASMLIS